MKKLSIAIDGPAGAGKSSVSKILAARLGYAYLDTGAMYRAVTYEALERKLERPEDIVSMTEKLDMEVKPDKDVMHVIVDGKDVTPYIRTPEVSGHVSEVSAIGGVRTAMVAIQRKQAEKGGIVLDGRDIGTTVLPKADVKISSPPLSIPGRCAGSRNSPKVILKCPWKMWKRKSAAGITWTAIGIFLR